MPAVAATSGWVPLARWSTPGRSSACTPNGHEGFWALGPEPSNADDIAFVETIITRLPLGDLIDGDRLYALGYSNGAGMVHRLASRPTTSAPLPPWPAPSPSTRSLRPVHTESVLQIHGMADDTCPYEGGDSPVEHVFEHAETSAAIWADAIGCTGAPTEEVTADGDIWLSWTDCPDGRAVQHVGSRRRGARHPTRLHGRSDAPGPGASSKPIETRCQLAVCAVAIELLDHPDWMCRPTATRSKGHLGHQRTHGVGLAVGRRLAGL